MQRDRTDGTHDIWHCRPCNKGSFPSRKAARLAVRTKHPNDNTMRPYSCPEVPGRWHYGHPLPEAPLTIGINVTIVLLRPYQWYAQHGNGGSAEVSGEITRAVQAALDQLPVLADIDHTVTAERRFFHTRPPRETPSAQEPA